jgi:hypothetical protein
MNEVKKSVQAWIRNSSKRKILEKKLEISERKRSITQINTAENITNRLDQAEERTSRKE